MDAAVRRGGIVGTKLVGAPPERYLRSPPQVIPARRGGLVSGDQGVELLYERFGKRALRPDELEQPVDRLLLIADEGRHQLGRLVGGVDGDERLVYASFDQQPGNASVEGI